jgi:hypothetical protein
MSKTPVIYSDNPNVVPAKIFSKKSIFGEEWYVKWTKRGEAISSTAEMKIGKGVKGGNYTLSGINFKYSVDWN